MRHSHEPRANPGPQAQDAGRLHDDRDADRVVGDRSPDDAHDADLGRPPAPHASLGSAGLYIQVQAGQNRQRSNGARYGNLADIGVPSTSASSHYTLRALSADESGCDVLATVVGAHDRDANCRNMSVRVAGVNLTLASWPDTSLANRAAVCARCWSL